MKFFLFLVLPSPTEQSTVPHFGELMYVTQEDEKTNKMRIILANFTGKIKDKKHFKN